VLARLVSQQTEPRRKKNLLVLEAARAFFYESVF